MAHVFRLPDIGEGLDEAEIVEWFVAIGDVVARDQALVEVLTDKASSELPSPVSGTVLSLGAAEGVRIRVGEVLIEIDDGSDTADAGALRPPSAAESVKDPVSGSTPQPSDTQRSATTTRPKAAPATRRLALQSGVDLNTVTGTGPAGRITADDVRNAETPVSASGPKPSTRLVSLPTDAGSQPMSSTLGQMPPGRHPLRGLRGVVARNMVQAWTEIPSLGLQCVIDQAFLPEGHNQPIGPQIPDLMEAFSHIRQQKSLMLYGYWTEAWLRAVLEGLPVSGCAITGMTEDPESLHRALLTD